MSNDAWVETTLEDIPKGTVYRYEAVRREYNSSSDGKFYVKGTGEPTIPGLYRDADGDLWGVFATETGNEFRIITVGKAWAFNYKEFVVDDYSEYGPFTSVGTV